MGALQGATEFLPVSSSGHLVVAQQWLGLDLPAVTLAVFDVALHAGTLLAVLCYYWRTIRQILRGHAWRLAGYLVIGTLPAALIGIPCKSLIESLFASVTVVAYAWLVTGVFLWCTHYLRGETAQPVTGRRALVVGIAQAFAMIPGISRSGATIATGLFLRISPLEAARFSFLLAIPAIGGSLLMEFGHLSALGPTMIPQLIVGVISAAIVGYLAIRWLIALIVRGQLRWFGCYCFSAGLLTLYFSRR